MKSTSLVVILYFASSYAINYRKCDQKGIRFYEEIGCVPKTIENGCPTSFSCPSQDLVPGKCRYKGRLYNAKENIKGTSSCRFSCFCSRPPKVTCASAMCPRPRYARNETCRIKHTPGACCDGVHCPQDNSVRCYFGGKEYLEGDRIETNACWDCACMKGFRGAFEEPFCKRTECGVELDHADKLADKSAPIYLHFKGGVKCCPHQYLSPKTAIDLKFINSGYQNGDNCFFGNYIQNYGTVFNATYDYYGKVKATTCSCDVPPIFTCVQFDY